MSTRRVADSQVKMPPNPQFLDFPRSDGSAETWPTNTQRIVDSSGEVNFQEAIPLDDGRAMRWRLGVAQAIAKKMELPSMSGV